MVHLFAAGGHILLSTAVYHRYLATQSQGRAGGIHCYVATANDDDSTTQIDGCVVLLVVAVHEVGAGKQFVGADHSDEGLARDVHKFG